jgi:hypothetical protein
MLLYLVIEFKQILCDRCENPQCSNPEFACKDLDEDLEAAARLKALYPGNHPN